MSPRRNRRRPAPRRAPADVEASFEHTRRQRERCAAKQWFATEDEARAHALMNRTTYGEDRVPYRCASCDGWHLATRP